MPLLSRSTARIFSLHGVSFASFASSATGAARLAGWSAEFAPQTPGQPHRMSSEELLHVLSGRLHVRIDGDEFVADGGDTVLVPAGSSFCVDNRTDAPAAAWVVAEIGMTATMLADGSHVVPPWSQ